MTISRRGFLGMAITGAAGAIAAGCTDGRRSASAARRPSAVAPPAGLTTPPTGSGGTVPPAADVNVAPTGILRMRGFDLEDDGPIALTLARGENAGEALLQVGSAYAHGGQGKGLSFSSANPAATKAYKNLSILPIAACWIRVSFSPRQSATTGTRIPFARINDSVNDESERLIWVTGEGVTSSSVKATVPVAAAAWMQLQLGIDTDGKVELWAFDGTQETLVGTGQSTIVGAVKDRVSIGNADDKLDTTFEMWIDDFAVGDSRMPWVRPEDPRTHITLQPLVADKLPPTFSFVFGSCSQWNHVPARGTALAASAAAKPDFVLQLGDLGYIDSTAYAQTVNGYLASLNDLLSADEMVHLVDRPWIRIASDHDMGGNNVTAATLSPFAAEAFAKFNSNDKSADGVGRYGSMTLDNGRILLIWTEGILHRSALNQPLAPGNTKLGPEQKAWLLDLLQHNTAKLIILASETPMGHQSNSSWVCHPAERREVIDALQATGALVRVLSGDLHHANWARLAPSVTEWCAAAMSDFPEGDPKPATDVIDSAAPHFGGFLSRPLALKALTIPEFNATTTFGHAVIDTKAATAVFELRRFDGSVWIDKNGRPMTETVRYA